MSDDEMLAKVRRALEAAERGEGCPWREVFAELDEATVRVMGERLGRAFAESRQRPEDFIVKRPITHAEMDDLMGKVMRGDNDDQGVK